MNAVERKAAVAVARLMQDDASQNDNVRLVSRALVLAATQLRLQHPIVNAATRMIDRTGHWTGRWTALYQDELVPAVKAWHDHTARNSAGRESP